MPILSFSMRSQDIDNPASETSEIATKTIKLNETYKMKYLKLLHIYHNINSIEIHDGDSISQAENTILFAKLSFLNSQQAVYYEVDNSGNVLQHNGLVCLGESVKDENQTIFRDCYKVLHSKGVLNINEPFSIQLFQLRSIEPATTNNDVAVYNAVNSHTIVPLSCTEFRGALNGPGQFISFVCEYEAEDTK
tara:strand:+ start:215 stop:790 length:576 start_codon:yes stop_codon:yes gene_type:complete